MEERSAPSRRVFIARAAGFTLTLGVGGSLRPYRAAVRNPYAAGVWLAGDHHIHTHYSSDGQYTIANQVEQAAQFGLGWCVITDHGGTRHDKIALAQAYPDLLAARRKFPQIVVFQGLEWNIPAAEHGSVILPPTKDEAKQIAEFEALYDERNTSRPNTPAHTEADAIAGVKYLQSLQPKPLFIANHPARRGLDSPHEFRAWAEAGPDVTRGFEGAPGHQAATLVGTERGGYDNKPAEKSWAGYAPETYRTFGGYDYYAAKVGGLWDSLLGEGRSWYITANSDSHRHWEDRVVVDSETHKTLGYVTPTDREHERNVNEDFYPGEYSKTWVYAARRDPLAILDGIRNGNMFTVLGDLIDRLEFYAEGNNRVAPMGGALLLEHSEADVTITLRVRVPRRPNGGGISPQLHHIDLIAGDILGVAKDRDAMTNPTTRVVAQWKASQGRRSGDFLVFTYGFPRVRQSFYVRARGTNASVDAPQLDGPNVNPWNDLWFYSNPIQVRVPG